MKHVTSGDGEIENKMERVSICLTNIKDQEAIGKGKPQLMKEELKQLKVEKES